MDDYSVDSILHEAFDNVLTQAMFLDQVLDITDNGILILDTGGAVTVANKASHEMLGFPDDGLLGADVRPLLAELTGADKTAWVDEFLASESKKEIAVLSRSGEMLHLVVGVRALKNERDEFAGHVLSLYNLTEEKNLQLALAEKNKRLSKLANRDALTGIYNRLYLEDYLSQKLIEARRYGRPLSVAMLDIDHFKKFNDTHGHLTGDLVLKRVAESVSKGCRKSDTATRYGGEEFCVILNGTPGAKGKLVAERIRKTIERTEVLHDDQILKVTVSMGVAEFNPERHNEMEDVISEADQALYTAKETGRNRVVLFGETPAPIA